MTYSSLITELTDHVLVVRLNRPEHLNAFTVEMGRGLVACFDDADRNDEVRVVIDLPDVLPWSKPS
jgi:enoyl-CoA hydratase/carnithine racemase